MPLERTPMQPDKAGVISWVHFGDLHMENADGQNYQDLLALIEKVNKNFACAASFAFFPGDNADKGSAAQYQLVRSTLDKLQLPWHAIVGDHDVQERSLNSFLHYLEPAAHFCFTVGDLHFFALNAFSTPEPNSFDLSDEQLDWLELQLQLMPTESHAVLLLHCYPSDLKIGAERLRALVQGARVLLIDMGHTHYNEVANDGHTLYTATRSTGQIEEGPVGFSITNIDGAVVSWRFLPLTEPSLVMITSPADERFLTSSTSRERPGGSTSVHAKFWGDSDGVALEAKIGGTLMPMRRIDDSQVWQADLQDGLADGSHNLVVTARLGNGTAVEDCIRLRVGPALAQTRKPRDQDNALVAWPERGLLGTQLGPNKNGKKW